MAEMVMKHFVRAVGRADDFYIDSAATDYDEIGNSMHRGTQNMLIRNNIPFTDHRARIVTVSDYDNFDLIICMDNENLRHLARIIGSDREKKVRKLLEYCGLSRDVADPWYTGNFEETFSDIEIGCKSLLKKLLCQNDSL
jgi:protein-tyrosine phosphatase